MDASKAGMDFGRIESFDFPAIFENQRYEGDDDGSSALVNGRWESVSMH